VVHVHNLFPHFGTHWLASWQGPLVATLHNFRPMCANGTLFRDGHRCTECLQTSPAAGVRHGCYANSHFRTVPLALAQRGGAPAHPVIRRADRLVAISQRAVDEYARAGVNPQRLAVVPNFVSTPPVTDRNPPRRERWLVTGRLSREKGVHELLAAWPSNVPLDVVGDGDCAAELRALAGPGVSFPGRRENAEVRAMLPRYTGLLVPSQWPEAGPPLTYLEALSAGVPTLAFAGNGAADDVARRGTGVVVSQVPSPDELAAAVYEVGAHRRELSARCLQTFDEHYSAARWVSAITRVYETAIAGQQVRRPMASLR
ncbi:MAG: glycosyltransferase family 4 protein, partial [Pseudonocardia sediminis]